MPVDLKAAIRKELAGSSSQLPVPTDALYKLGTQKRVKAALMELYQAHETYCCKIFKGGQESVVWWLVGRVSAPHSFGRTGTSRDTLLAKPAACGSGCEEAIPGPKASPSRFMASRSAAA